MRILFLILSLLSVSKSFADDCRSEKVFQPQTREFLSCKVESVTPTYRVEAEIPVGEISELDCTLFCSSSTLFPIPHGDHFHIQRMPRVFLDELLELWRQGVRLNPLLERVPPEVFLQTILSSILDSNGESESIPEELWDQHVQSKIHKKDSSQVLLPHLYKRIEKKDLPEPDQIATNPDSMKCTICCESLAAQLEKGEEVVQINCSSNKEVRGGHIFCRTCIEESYKYQQICPTCRGEIKP